MNHQPHRGAGHRAERVGDNQLISPGIGVLAHLGLSPSQSWALVAMEVGFLLLVAIFWATLLGGMIGEILIQKINPQSFHWTMETYIEIEQWAMVSLLLLFVGVLTSRWAARQGLEPKRLAQSLRADW